MYIAEHTCTYQHVRNKNETDTEEVLLDLENCQYRSDLLSVFNLKIYDEIAIQTEISKLFDMIKADAFFSKCFESVYSDTNNIICLVVLFSFEYFYATHRCISDWICSNAIKEENAILLETLLKKQ